MYELGVGEQIYFFGKLIESFLFVSNRKSLGFFPMFIIINIYILCVMLCKGFFSVIIYKIIFVTASTQTMWLRILLFHIPVIEW